jgi:hypothetical protein
MDKTGRNLHAGHLVDLQLMGMFTGAVVQVNDSVIAVPGQPPMPKSIVVSFAIPVPADQRNICHGVYIIGRVSSDQIAKPTNGDDKAAEEPQPKPELKLVV